MLDKNLNVKLHEEIYVEITKIIAERYPRIKGAYCASIAYGIIDFISARDASAALAQRTAGGDAVTHTGMPHGWRATLEAEKAAQEQHYGEAAACAVAGDKLYAGERDMTEGVIKGVEYCIARLDELSAAQPVAEAAAQVVGVTLPRDPTQAMLTAGFSKMCEVGKREIGQIYTAMLIARADSTANVAQVIDDKKIKD